MSYPKLRGAPKVSVQQVSKLAQEYDVWSRCPGCQKMILERTINHPCLEWPFRELA